MKLIVFTVALAAIIFYVCQPTPLYYCLDRTAPSGSIKIIEGLYPSEVHDKCMFVGVGFYNPKEVW